MPLHLDTPLLRSTPLSSRTGRTVLLKMDALQPPGSFKIRGIGAACETYAAEGKRRFVSSSGGNAGLAVAYAGRRLGIPVTVVIPQSTPGHARALLEQEGAEVVIHGAVWAEANEHAQSMLDADAAFLHPFDNPSMWTGHATLIDEVVRTGTEFDCVILSVGGGGLLCGVMEGLDRNELRNVPVFAVETVGADCLANALSKGENVAIPAITSIATSLGANRASEQAFAYARTRDVRSIVLPDREAVEACYSFVEDHRVLVEPACGAALALIYQPERVKLLKNLSNPLVVVCGGAMATLEKLVEWRRTTRTASDAAAA